MLDGMHDLDETAVAEGAPTQAKGETSVYMTVGELWRLIHQTPNAAPPAVQPLAGD